MVSFASVVWFFVTKEVFEAFLFFSPNTCHQDVEKYKLENPRGFHYLNQSNCIELDGLDDSKEYLATRRAMDVVGISQEEQVIHFDCYFS